MALSSTSKAGIALGTILPVCTAVYTEQQKRVESQRAAQQERTELLLARQQQALEQDRSTAQALLKDLRGLKAGEAEDEAHGSELCGSLYDASEMVRLGLLGEPTRNALIIAFSYRPETDPAARPRICACPNTLEQMLDRWRPREDSGVSNVLGGPLITALSDARDECAITAPVAVSFPPPAPVVLPSPQPIPPPEPGEPPASTPPADGGLVAGAGSPSRVDEGGKVRVYIQYPTDNERPLAQCLQHYLTFDYGFRVPPVERVGASRAPSTGQVRYVYREDDALAQQLLEAARTVTTKECTRDITVALTAPMERYRNRAVARSLELWLPALPEAQP